MKLITFGCSVTHLEGVKEELASLLNLPLLNVAVCAGSNQLQLSKLSELIVNERIARDDIIYWQVTSTERDYNCLPSKYAAKVLRIEEEQFAHSNSPWHYQKSEEPNIFDGEYRYHLCCNSPMLNIPYRDDNKELERLLSTICLVKQLCPKILVVFGWRSVMSAEHMIIFRNKLKAYNVDYLVEGYVDYCVRNRLRFDIDDMHPGIDAGKVFAHTVFEKIKHLGWA